MESNQASLTTGTSIDLDGNLDRIIETIYDEIIVKNAYQADFSDVASEISFLISQMSSDDKDRYLFISIGALVDKLHMDVREELDSGSSNVR
jgi:hypothetical protein